jgi:hypothetical protein
MAMIDRNFDFATNGTVSAAALHALIDSATIYQDLITGQVPITSVGTNYELLIADGTNPNAAPNAVTVYDLFDDALTAGTYTNANISAALTYGTATGTRLVSANATITTGTIPNLTAGTTTSTAATITNGTITTALIPTLTVGTTTGTAGIFTSGTVATLNSTTGTIGTLNSTTGTIANLSTTLAGDFTISQGTATLATSGATAGTYGSVTAIPFITVDAKGRITSATTGTFSSTPADGSITAPKLSGAQTGSAPIYGVRAWCYFNGTTNGTNAPTGGGNVASVIRNTQGNYTITFSTSMPDTNYAFVASARNTTVGAVITQPLPDSLLTTSSITFNCFQSNTLNAADPEYVYVMIIR